MVRINIDYFYFKANYSCLHDTKLKIPSCSKNVYLLKCFNLFLKGGLVDGNYCNTVE